MKTHEYVVVQFNEYEQAVRYVSVNADDDYPLDIMPIDSDEELS